MDDPNWNLLKAKSPAICSYPVQPIQIPLKRTARAKLPTNCSSPVQRAPLICLVDRTCCSPTLTIKLPDWPTDLVATTAAIVDETPRPHGDNKRKRHLNRANWAEVKYVLYSHTVISTTIPASSLFQYLLLYKYIYIYIHISISLSVSILWDIASASHLYEDVFQLPVPIFCITHLHKHVVLLYTFFLHAFLDQWHGTLCRFPISILIYFPSLKTQAYRDWGQPLVTQPSPVTANLKNPGLPWLEITLGDQAIPSRGKL